MANMAILFTIVPVPVRPVLKIQNQNTNSSTPCTYSRTYRYSESTPCTRVVRTRVQYGILEQHQHTNRENGPKAN